MTQGNDVQTPRDGRAERQDTWRDTLLSWLVIAGVVFTVLVLLLMTFDASIINFNCFLTDFLRGKCARWGRWW